MIDKIAVYINREQINREQIASDLAEYATVVIDQYSIILLTIISILQIQPQYSIVSYYNIISKVLSQAWESSSRNLFSGWYEF